MKYEIPREAFKQRLEDRLNFAFIDLNPADRTPVQFKDVNHISYDSKFKEAITAQYPNKAQNILLYSLQKGDDSPAKAADELSALGYHFVYYYKGSPDDVTLDKGMN